MRLADPIWISAFHINERKVKDYRRGRVFLAGDAAHIHSPAGGQGMNTGIQDACNLAWKLALVQHGVCAAEPLLGSYTAERSPIADAVLREAGLLTKVGVLEGELPQAVRNAVIHAVLGLAPAGHAMAEQMTELSIGYPKSPLTVSSLLHHGGPPPGTRAPLRAGEPPVGAGDRPRFALFAAGDTAELLTRFAALLEPTLRAPFHDGGLWLVRPDGYVALAAKAGAWDEVAGYLERMAA